MRRTDRVADFNAGTTDVSRANRLRILQYLRDQETHTRVELARDLRMSPATVNRLSRLMLQLELIEEVGAEDVKSGRPATLIRFNPHARIALAAAVSPDYGSISMAGINLDGDMAERWDYPTSPRTWLDDLTGGLHDWLTAKGNDPHYWTAGVAVPSGMDTPTVERATLQLREHLDLPTFVERDCAALALAEYYLTDLGKMASLVTIEVGTNTGAGIIIDGEIWRGLGGTAGNLSEIHGGWNSVADTTADEASEALFEKYAVHLIDLCAILAPDCLLLSGQVAERLGPVLSELSARLEKQLAYPPLLRKATLGEDGKLIGAGLSAMRLCGGVGSLF